MEVYNIPPCREIGELKEYVKNAILDGVIGNSFEEADVLMRKRAVEMGLNAVNKPSAYADRRFPLIYNGVRRYSRRTQEIYAGILKEFNEYAASYSLPQEPAASQEGKVNADVDFILRALDKTIIRNYEVYLSDERKLNARTINQHLSVLSSFCRWLMGQGLLKCNPVKLVSRPKCEKRLPVSIVRIQWRIISGRLCLLQMGNL